MVEYYMNIALRRFLHNHGNIATDNGNNGGTVFSQILEYYKWLNMLLITEHYHDMGLLACSQTLPSTEYPTYKIHCMIFVSPLCPLVVTSCPLVVTISCSVIGQSQWDEAWGISRALDCLASHFRNQLNLRGSIRGIALFLNVTRRSH